VTLLVFFDNSVFSLRKASASILKTLLRISFRFANSIDLKFSMSVEVNWLCLILFFSCSFLLGYLSLLLSIFLVAITAITITAAMVKIPTSTIDIMNNFICYLNSNNFYIKATELTQSSNPKNSLFKWQNHKSCKSFGFY